MITPIRSIRLVHILAVFSIILILYLSGPYSRSKPVHQSTSNADARLARWLETVTTDISSAIPANTQLPTSSHAQRPLDKSRPLVPLNPYPLGKPSTTSEAPATQQTLHETTSYETVSNGKEFVDVKFSFQQDLSLQQPQIDLTQYKRHTPHHYSPAAQQETFATFLCTPNASMYDPYFSATLNLVYRNLWSPQSASKSRPFTVFVAPFVTQEQRDILAGAGAIIKELELLPWEPNIDGVWARWRDQFSKLHMWAQTQYSAIAFMDSDAFPIANIDSVFDEARAQDCDESKLPAEEQTEKDKVCNYTFAGVENVGMDGSVNGGFLFLTPSLAMHRRLLRNYVKVDQYDNRVAEQSFFQWQFAQDGPFPVQLLPRKYNAFFPQDFDEGLVSVVHEKLWAWGDSLPPWLRGSWEKGWQDMLDFFDSPEFASAREQDNTISMPEEHQGITRDTETAARGSIKGMPEVRELSEELAEELSPTLSQKQRMMMERTSKMKTTFFSSSP